MAYWHGYSLHNIFFKRHKQCRAPLLAFFRAVKKSEERNSRKEMEENGRREETKEQRY